ncbi:MAG: hypothetical protein JXR76_22835 [Deltaproteobacteria bacterium]|nr:hypothetical protein [Deltaproteobacteria bacterium]
MKSIINYWKEEKLAREWLGSLQTVSPNQDLILHVGPPKTGTSAIQQYCVTHRDLLRKHGYYYPSHPLNQNGVSAGHGYWIRQLEKRQTEANRILRRCISAAKANGYTLLLSAEAFWRMPHKFNSIIGNSQYRVQVVAMLRHPHDLAISRYNQAIKRNFYREDIATFLEQRIQNSSDIGTFLGQWSQLAGPGNMIVTPYNKNKLLRAGMAQTFLKILNIPKPMHIRRRNNRLINSSYLPELLELKRRFNGILTKDDIDLNSKIDFILQNASDRHLQQRSSQYPCHQTEVDEQTMRVLTTACASELDTISTLTTVPLESELCVQPYTANRSPLVELTLIQLDKAGVLSTIRQRLSQFRAQPDLSHNDQRTILQLEKLIT